MNRPAFRVHPDAVEEAFRAAQWYRRRSANAAARFLQELNQVFDKIIDAPRRWPLGLAGTRKVKVPSFPFLVFYRETEEKILVLAVAHGRREPNYWRDRL